MTKAYRDLQLKFRHFEVTDRQKFAPGLADVRVRRRYCRAMRVFRASMASHLMRRVRRAPVGSDAPRWRPGCASSMYAATRQRESTPPREHRSFHVVTRRHEAEVNELVGKVLQADELIHRQQLGWDWKPPVQNCEHWRGRTRRRRPMRKRWSGNG